MLKKLQYIRMKKTINIATGEVKMGTAGDLLVSNGIGSCIVIIGINLKKEIGAVAHFMLPGKAPENEKQSKTKYAEDAMLKLLQELQIKENDARQYSVCLVGAGNVLQKQDDTICESNIQSIYALLDNLKTGISATSLGGNCRRSVSFDVETGEVFITTDDSKLTLLHCFKQKNHSNNEPNS